MSRSRESAKPDPSPRDPWVEWRWPVVLVVVTFISTFYVGAESHLYAMLKRPANWTQKWSTLEKPIEAVARPFVGMDSWEFFGWLLEHPEHFLAGWTFAVPLMTILIAHEMGHYVAARIHRVDTSPPFFIPFPSFLGTMGAVIQMRGAIKTRNALLDIGAAGPLAGMAVALPVVLYGLSISRVGTIEDLLPATLGGDPSYMVEGHGILYIGLIYLMKGSMGPGQDVWLSPWAMAGWAGFLVTMINMIPVSQLDGGHVAYALFGKKQDTYSRRVHRLLPVVGLVVSAGYVIPAYLAGERSYELMGEAMAGFNWVFWAFVLVMLMRLSGPEHPPTGPEPLSRSRRWVAVGTLVLFCLLFMPSWVYVP